MYISLVYFLLLFDEFMGINIDDKYCGVSLLFINLFVTAFLLLAAKILGFTLNTVCDHIHEQLSKIFYR